MQQHLGGPCILPSPMGWAGILFTRSGEPKSRSLNPSLETYRLCKQISVVDEQNARAADERAGQRDAQRHLLAHWMARPVAHERRVAVLRVKAGKAAARELVAKRASTCSAICWPIGWPETSHRSVA